MLCKPNTTIVLLKHFLFLVSFDTLAKSSMKLSFVQIELDKYYKVQHSIKLNAEHNVVQAATIRWI